MMKRSLPGKIKRFFFGDCCKQDTMILRYLVTFYNFAVGKIAVLLLIKIMFKCLVVD